MPIRQFLMAPLLGALLLGSFGSALKTGQTPPKLQGGPWLNTPTPEGYSLESLRGKVVLVNFWVYSCINCHNSLPTLSNWYSKYHDQGLEIIGVHTPEFESDKPLENVRAALLQDKVVWPVLQDNALSNWQAWKNQYWPAFYFIDRKGTVRAIHNGEISSRFPGAIPGLEATLKTLLAEK
ncbi:thioredoxin [Deinococcus psychrotolerans]|uniref:Thioredoxin n=1 Tax=Deinococcus psychrotolerans TaxID=2489213 RepID=A0A3G8YNT2_9DEIO|nr:redoxin domain-containing protein [Deinococcus psychrotolerans]AZI44274.1 thioredoxin [Deinococcus psychrotolerans]